MAKAKLKDLWNGFTKHPMVIGAYQTICSLKNGILSAVRKVSRVISKCRINYAAIGILLILAYARQKGMLVSYPALEWIVDCELRLIEWLFNLLREILEWAFSKTDDIQMPIIKDLLEWARYIFGM